MADLLIYLAVHASVMLLLLAAYWLVQRQHNAGRLSDQLAKQLSQAALEAPIIAAIALPLLLKIEYYPL